MINKMVAVNIGLCFLLLICPFSMLAFQENRGNSNYDRSQEDNLVYGPDWIIPSTFNSQAEDVARNRQEVLTATDIKSTPAQPVQETSEALPLKGPKGSGLPVGSSGGSESISDQAFTDIFNDGLDPYVKEVNDEVMNISQAAKRLFGEKIKRTTIYDDGTGGLGSHIVSTEYFYPGRLTYKDVVIYLDEERTMSLAIEATFSVWNGRISYMHVTDRYDGDTSAMDFLLQHDWEGSRYFGLFSDIKGLFSGSDYGESYKEGDSYITVKQSSMGGAGTLREYDRGRTYYHYGVEQEELDNSYSAFVQFAVAANRLGVFGNISETRANNSGLFSSGANSATLSSMLSAYQNLRSSNKDNTVWNFKKESDSAVTSDDSGIGEQSSVRVEKPSNFDETAKASRYSHIRNLRYIEAAVEVELESQDLSDIVAELGSKNNLTDTESSLLEAAQAVARDSEDIDDETMKSFTEAAYYIRIAESMKDILEGVNFSVITKALETLVNEHARLYDQFLSLTRDAYGQIAKLLALSSEDEKLPARYNSLSGLDVRMKLKILADMRLREILNKEITRLNENEKEALKIYNTSIRQLREDYKKDLTSVIDKFTYEVKKALINTEGATAKESDGQFKALFLLDTQSR